MAQKDCYELFGYTSATQAQRALDGIKWEIGFFGDLQVDASGTIVAGTPPPAQSSGNIIQISYSYNWLDFSKVTAEIVGTGQIRSYDYLAAVNAILNQNLSSSDLATMIILHELLHVPGKPQGKDFVAFNLPIVEKCLGKK